MRSQTIQPTSIRVTIDGTDYAINLYSPRYYSPEKALDAGGLGRADEMDILDARTGRYIGTAFSEWGSDEWTLGTHGKTPVDPADPLPAIGRIALSLAQEWTATQAAAYLGLGSARAARTQLDRWGVQASGRDLRSGEKLYLATAVREAKRNAPGRGKRTDLKEKAMSTTEYGSWYNFEGSNLTVEDTVAVFLGEVEDDYDIDGLAHAYRSAINDALPEHVSLTGDEFYGPYPKGDDLDDQINEAIESVDLGALADEYDKS